MAKKVIASDSSTDEKYVTFKRADLQALLSKFKPLSSMSMSTLYQEMAEIELADAVVIRRQDYFASPALATYATSIAMTVRLIDDERKGIALMQIADYFQRQSELAGEEGWKFPDV